MNDPIYVLLGVDSYGSTCVRRGITRENLEQEVLDFCADERIDLSDITVCEVIPSEMGIKVKLATD